MADERAYKRIRQDALDNIKKSVFAEGLSLFGTTGGVEISSAICDIPVIEPSIFCGAGTLS